MSNGYFFSFSPLVFFLGRFGINSAGLAEPNSLSEDHDLIVLHCITGNVQCGFSHRVMGWGGVGGNVNIPPCDTRPVERGGRGVARVVLTALVCLL